MPKSIEKNDFEEQSKTSAADVKDQKYKSEPKENQTASTNRTDSYQVIQFQSLTCHLDNMMMFYRISYIVQVEGTIVTI